MSNYISLYFRISILVSFSHDCFPNKSVQTQVQYFWSRNVEVSALLSVCFRKNFEKYSSIFFGEFEKHLMHKSVIKILRDVKDETVCEVATI